MNKRRKRQRVTGKSRWEGESREPIRFSKASMDRRLQITGSGDDSLVITQRSKAIIRKLGIYIL